MKNLLSEEKESVLEVIMNTRILNYGSMKIWIKAKYLTETIQLTVSELLLGQQLQIYSSKDWRFGDLVINKIYNNNKPTGNKGMRK